MGQPLGFGTVVIGKRIDINQHLPNRGVVLITLRITPKERHPHQAARQPHQHWRAILANLPPPGMTTRPAGTRR